MRREEVRSSCGVEDEELFTTWMGVSYQDAVHSLQDALWSVSARFGGRSTDVTGVPLCPGTGVLRYFTKRAGLSQSP